MALNIGSQGSFTPWVKFDAKAGRWFVKKDEQQVEVNNPTFVADFATIKTGWLFFKEGAGPEVVHDISLSQPAPKPVRTYVDKEGKTRDCFKRGFTLALFSNQAFGGVVEMQSSSMHLCAAINELYEAYEAGLAANPGALPVVQCTGVIPMKDKAGTNYKPVFVIVKWVTRPVEFDAPATQPVPQAASAQQGYGYVQQPAPQYAAPQPAPQPAPVQQPPVNSVSEF